MRNSGRLAARTPSQGPAGPPPGPAASRRAAETRGRHEPLPHAPERHPEVGGQEAQHRQEREQERAQRAGASRAPRPAPAWSRAAPPNTSIGQRHAAREPTYPNSGQQGVQ